MRWLLERLEIEGFRGINNEGDPLVLKLKTDAVNSLSAPNGVGKSSIFDALSFAIRGEVPKLKELQAAENGDQYYNNRFHSKGVGTITLALKPEGAGANVTIKVTRAADGTRTVSAPTGVDGEALLAELDRDFVLLDYRTLQTFIDDKALDRGRAFAGLLGLERYSNLRRSIASLENTTAYNNHFGARALKQRREAATASVLKHLTAAREAFRELTQEQYADQADHTAAVLKAYDALDQITVIKEKCAGKMFGEISIDECVEAISLAEGGEDRAKLTKLLQDETTWKARLEDGLSDTDRDELQGLAKERDAALAQTSGTLLRELYKASHDVLWRDDWPDKDVCPTCGEKAGHSVLASVEAKLAHYATVEQAGEKILGKWTERGWNAAADLEAATIEEGESALFAAAVKSVEKQSLTADEVNALWLWRANLIERGKSTLAAIETDRQALEKKLPKSMVAVTKTVEAARKLQTNWADQAQAQAELSAANALQARADRVKQFLVKASDAFAKAETDASQRRLSAVEPLFQALFAGIVSGPIKPSLQKAGTSEALTLSLTEFFTLNNVSAQALLSESFRNAFAVTVYLAAASLYGGAPLFVVLDDVTSSFDGGHQFHLMEVIRAKFARPAMPNGPQVILLSHDTLLEKLFNKHAGTPHWNHHRLEGTAQTAVLPQSIAANHVKDAIDKALLAGQVKSAAPRIREYLEFKLQEIINRVSIPVPLDFALDDNKKLPQTCIDAITDHVALHQAAGKLILTTAQEGSLTTHVAQITGNYLSHYATGQSSAFTASALQGVMASIDAYADCFMHENPPGSGKKRYYRSLAKK